MTELTVIGNHNPSLVEIVRSLEEAGALTPTQLKLPAEITFEQYEALGGWIGVVSDAAKWWLSDWLVFGAGVFSDRMEQAAKQTKRSAGTLENYARIGAAIPPSRRIAKLSYSHHAEVASLDPKAQTTWLKKAEAAQWSSHELRSEIRADRNGDEIGPSPSPSSGELLVEAVRSLLANAEEAGENVICRREDVVRVRAAIGEA